MEILFNLSKLGEQQAHQISGSRCILPGLCLPWLGCSACLLLMLRTFRALGNPCRLLGSTLRRRPGGVSFSLVSPLGWRVSTSCSGRVARSGWAQAWESFILLKGFSAQWGSSQIKRHLTSKLHIPCSFTKGKCTIWGKLLVILKILPRVLTRNQ